MILLFLNINVNKLSKFSTCLYQSFVSISQVDIADPPFPRNAGYWWFGCRAENKGHRQEVTAAPSVLRPTWLEVRRDHKGNQNTDVGDLILDAGEAFCFTHYKKWAEWDLYIAIGVFLFNFSVIFLFIPSIRLPERLDVQIKINCTQICFVCVLYTLCLPNS